jgi:type IV secretory pathway VirB9-like protein
MKYVLIMAVLFAGCATTPPPPPAPVVMQAPTPKPPVPADPYAGMPSDEAYAIQHNETPTLQHGITLIYPYSQDLAYPINCQPLEATEIILGPGEFTSDKDVIIGDSERWNMTVGDGVVLVKPARTTQTLSSGPQDPVPEVHPGAINMTTNIHVHTNLRNYTVLPRIRKPVTQQVEWYYPDDVRAQAAARAQALKETRQ